MRIPPGEYLELDLRAHSLLADVPLHDVSAVDLVGGGAGRTMQDVRAVLPSDGIMRANPMVASLFRLRWFLGRLFGWDRPTENADAWSYRHRLTEADRERSLVVPGSADGLFRFVYAFPHETLSELRNRTVHGFICGTLREIPGGYRLYWGIYVLPVSRITGWYMAAIAPFRRFVVYPAMLGAVRRAWARRYAA